MAMAGDIDPMKLAAQLFRDQPAGFPFEGYDLEELILPDGDDMGLRSDEDASEEEEVEAVSGFGSVIVVDNLPAVPEEKYEKLANVLKKIYGQIGSIRDGGVYMPKDPETKMSKGFAFIEFSHPMEAQAARAQTNGYQLDKNHKFLVTLFDDFERYGRVPDEYAPPENKAVAPQDNLHSWLTDKLGRDQFAIRFGDDTMVCWNDARRGRADEVYKRTFWTESFVQWSPLGNMLGTMHRQGIAVWGGKPGGEFVRLNRFQHPGAQLIDFSPGERYLMAYSSIEPTNPRDSMSILLNIFDTRSGKMLRRFEGPMEEYAVGAAAGPQGSLRWPFFKWAGGTDDQYFARLGKGKLCVHQTSDMYMIGKKSIELIGISDFEWSPVEPLLAIYTAESGQTPARVTLMRIPDKVELRQKNMYSVSDAKVHWHPQGDYLAVKVDRFTKTKKSTTTSFELFSIRERDIPMEVLELPNKTERILSFAWEPKGHRFAVVHGEGGRPTVSFYSMKDAKGKLGVHCVGTLQNKSCNGLHWSPAGHNIVLSGLKALNGQLEFFNVDEFETMATAEHFMATDVEWDPTGRYVATYVNATNQMENGFNIWTFNGRLLYNMQRDRFYQFCWRPRMPCLLPADKEAEIVKNLKAYSKRYDEEDEALLMQADADVLQERQKMADEWRTWAEGRAAYAEAQAAFRREMCGALADEPEFTVKTVTVEQVLDMREEPYNANN
ncbi:MAG: eukaryotic initiation factor [Monoraphidium minutum]|nr:MAG: eukaryotic initiation factor [Monoraphidium minutum]